MAQRERQCAVAAHRMAEDRDAGSIDVERVDEDVDQLVDDVRRHAKARRPRRTRRIEVEARAFAEVPVGGRAVDAGLSRAGVRRDEHEAALRREALRAGLDRERLLGAGQAGEIDQRGRRDEARRAARRRRSASGRRSSPIDVDGTTVRRRSSDGAIGFRSTCRRENGTSRTACGTRMTIERRRDDPRPARRHPAIGAASRRRTAAPNVSREYSAATRARAASRMRCHCPASR